MLNVINRNIFREYDIRGVWKETLSEKDAYLIGKGFCAQALKNKDSTIAVGRDGRLSSPKLSEALINGILDSGTNVINIGCCPTPMLYFTRPFLKVDAAIMVTGSHNPPKHNGFKIMLEDRSFFGKDIETLYQTIKNNKFIDGKGFISNINILHDYKNSLLKNSGPFPNIKVVWDCGNGASGEIITEIVKDLPGEHHVLFGDIDGNFPNHHPDPVVKENLKDLMNEIKIRNADYGIAFDGDGDRIGVVTKDGEMVPGDLLTAFLSGGISKTYKRKKIILDIKSSQAAINSIKKNGGDILIWKTGHSNIKSKLKEINSPLAGEMSGHIFFSDSWYGFDDALYASLRFLQEHRRTKSGIDKFLKELPKFFTSPEIRIDCDDQKKFKVIEDIKNAIKSKYPKENINEIDGVRVSFDYGWWLIRASNTQSAIILRAEGKSELNLSFLMEEVSTNLSLAGITWAYKK